MLDSPISTDSREKTTIGVIPTVTMEQYSIVTDAQSDLREGVAPTAV